MFFTKSQGTVETPKLSRGIIDLTGVFCTSGSERKFTLEGRWYADET
jgi:hypothetical protein